MSAGALRRPARPPREPASNPVFHQRHDLRVTQTDFVASRRRPAEMRALKALREQTKTRTVPPNIFILSARFARKTYREPSNGSAPASRTRETNPSGPFRKSTPPLATAPRALRDHASRTARADGEGRLPECPRSPATPPANLDLHPPRLGRTRLRRRLALDLLRPQSCGAPPPEQLRRRDIQRTRQRRNIRAWLQRRRDRSILELVGPTPAFSNQRSIETFRSDLYELVRVSSAHRRRHRCCYPCPTITKRAPRAARMAPAGRLLRITSRHRYDGRHFRDAP